MVSGAWRHRRQSPSESRSSRRVSSRPGARPVSMLCSRPWWVMQPLCPYDRHTPSLACSPSPIWLICWVYLRVPCPQAYLLSEVIWKS
ncbi:unnamed protein product [Dibothriocephalus latus]|uniref:Uncharacterized protein n=1 Tax=Dibothriocephalus latus TaxID=60516 RepID=A0A3P7P8E1_DIBLA|nr:unnamed protein product [Dibothriocephalus latus]